MYSYPHIPFRFHNARYHGTSKAAAQQQPPTIQRPPTIVRPPGLQAARRVDFLQAGFRELYNTWDVSLRGLLLLIC